MERIPMIGRSWPTCRGCGSAAFVVQEVARVFIQKGPAGAAVGHAKIGTRYLCAGCGLVLDPELEAGGGRDSAGTVDNEARRG